MIKKGKTEDGMENQVHHYTRRSGSRREPTQFLPGGKEVKLRIVKYFQRTMIELSDANLVLSSIPFLPQDRAVRAKSEGDKSKTGKSREVWYWTDVLENVSRTL